MELTAYDDLTNGWHWEIGIIRGFDFLKYFIILVFLFYF